MYSRYGSTYVCLHVHVHVLYNTNVSVQLNCALFEIRDGHTDYICLNLCLNLNEFSHVLLLTRPTVIENQTPSPD